MCKELSVSWSVGGTCIFKKKTMTNLSIGQDRIDIII